MKTCPYCDSSDVEYMGVELDFEPETGSSFMVDVWLCYECGGSFQSGGRFDPGESSEAANES